VLTGEGADEAFAGYPWTTVPNRAEMSWVGPIGGLLARAAGRGFGAAVLGGGGAKLDARGPFATTGAAQLYALTARSRAFLYSRTMWERLGTSSPGDDHVWDARIGGWHPLHQSLYADYECVLAGHLLLDKGDRVAMASGIEPRFPYLDETVVALAASLDPSFKLRGSRDKWILRELARRHLAPEIADREKLMFRAEPVIHAVGRPPWVDELLSPPSLLSTGLFDPVKVQRALVERATPSRHPRSALLQGGLTAVVSTQLLAHLYGGAGLCSLPAWSP
jgi:asparagine synthase (glutamine-hydrolysing)